MSTPAAPLDEDCFDGFVGVDRSRPLRLPMEYFDEHLDASRVDTDVDRRSNSLLLSFNSPSCVKLLSSLSAYFLSVFSMSE